MTKPCLVFNGARTQDGYGHRWYKGKVEYTHRIAWIETNGQIPNGLCVLHKCDNRPCFEITHLFLGTRADNMIDKTKKGRGKNPNQRISNEQALEIRKRFSNGENKISLSKCFGVSVKNIYAIIHKISFKNI